MHFFLVSIFIYLSIVAVSWVPKFGLTALGIADIIPFIYESAKNTFTNGHAFGIFAFGFFIYAFLKSGTIQALVGKYRKSLQKRGLLTVVMLTLMASLLGSFLLWYDEFIHFYPLIVPLFLSMGLDSFSAFLCFFLGSSAGVAGTLTSYSQVFQTYSVNQGNIKFEGSSGWPFRLACWFLFTTIVILFNVWYCNKIRNSSVSNKENSTKDLEKKSIPSFNYRRKFVLLITFFFIIGSIISSVGWFTNKCEPVAKEISPWIAGEYEREKDHKELGKVGGELEIAEVTQKKKGYWGVLGSWDDFPLSYWFTLGAIAICLISKLSIPMVMLEAIKNVMPMILAYIFMGTVKLMLNASQIGDKVSKFLPDKPIENAKYFFLIGLFFFFFILSLVASGIGMTLTSVMVKILRPISKSVLLHGVIIMVMARFLSITWSPSNGILQASLKENNITYKEYVKKTWALGLIMFLAGLALITVWTKLVIK